MLKFSEMKTWDEAVINSKITELRGEIFNFRIQRTTSGLDKPHRVKETKKTIARLQTILNSRREK